MSKLLWRGRFVTCSYGGCILEKAECVLLLLAFGLVPGSSLRITRWSRPGCSIGSEEGWHAGLRMLREAALPGFDPHPHSRKGKLQGRGAQIPRFVFVFLCGVSYFVAMSPCMVGAASQDALASAFQTQSLGHMVTSLLSFHSPLTILFILETKKLRKPRC